MNRVKTCVYAISLNEIKHVDKFMDANVGADLVLVCDTGSTDGTVERLRERGAVVHEITQKPWRFDVPRNTALSLIPPDIDICLSIDLDEYLQPGWADEINAAWQQQEGTTKRISYDYIWNWTIDGQPDVRFNADKIHHRHGYIWRHPCHETLYYVGEGQEVRAILPDLQLQHHADTTKSRGQYIDLLKLAVDEEPNNDRMRHYYGRELMFRSRWEEAIVELNNHLNLPSAQWKEERASSYRFISRCYRHLDKPHESLTAAVKSTLEWPYSREPWLDLARAGYFIKDWNTCYYATTKCLSILERTQTYMNDGACWGPEPYDLAALSAYNLGLHQQATDMGQKALSFNINDERLKGNLKYYNEKLDEEKKKYLPKNIFIQT